MIGNRAVARLLAPRGRLLSPNANLTIQRVAATIKAERKVGLHLLHTSRKAGSKTAGKVKKQAAPNIPPGTTVDMDTDTKATDVDGNPYTLVTYNGQSGYVRDKYLLALRPHTAGPKAGFELEFTNVFVMPKGPEKEDSKALVELARKGSAASQDEMEAALKKVKENPSEKAPFPKRTVIFVSPKGTWSATTDTTYKNLSNVEIVGAPLTPDELDGPDVEADKKTLEVVQGKLRKPQNWLQEPRDLAEGLVVTSSDFVFVNLSSGAFALDHVQLTQAKPLPQAEAEPEWWLPGLNYAAWPVLRKIVGVMKRTSYTGSNPKNLFNPNLPKVSVATLLGKPQAEDKKKEEIWVAEVAATLSVKPEEQVGRKLVEYSEGLLKPTEFTWKEFFEDLLKGEDRIAEWSKTAFEGVEDFGYGMINDPTLPPNWHIEETRDLGSRTVGGIWNKQKEWAKETRAALQQATL
jgi:hypothetical protein